MFTAQQKQIENCSRFESVTKTLTEHSQMKSKENLNNNENIKKIETKFICLQSNKRDVEDRKKEQTIETKKKQNQKRSKIKQRK